MNILFVTTTLGTRGGIQRVTTVKANCFADMPGNNVAIAFSDRLGWPENAIHPLSDKVNVYDMKSPFWDREPKKFDILWRFPQKALRLRKKIKQVIEDFNPDIVISTGQFEKFIIPFIHLIKRKYVIIREYHFSSNYQQIEYKIRYGKDSLKPKLINIFENRCIAPLFDCNYLLTKQDKEENHSKNRHFRYMWNPSSFNVCTDFTIDNKEPVIIAVGRLTAQKNFKDLLEIWSRTYRKDWRLRILGDGEDKENLKSLAVKLGISESAEIAGYSSDVKGEMQNASIFVGTSTFEGFMLVIVEAMSQGCVPISYDTPYGPRDIISNGIDGFLIDMYDKDTFAKRLSELIANKEEREKMALKAIERAHDFDVSKICNDWMVEYNQLLNKKRNKAY